jgi:hypothetical protein
VSFLIAVKGWRESREGARLLREREREREREISLVDGVGDWDGWARIGW